MSFQWRLNLALFCVALVVAAVTSSSAEPIREGSYAARRNLIFDGEGRQDLELLKEEPELRGEIREECMYRVAHLLQERNMLTSISKFRWWPGSEDKLTTKCNFKFGVNIFLSQNRWATL